MANTYFKFKQFTVHQDQCAMKVSTEACILGAWVDDESARQMLDIGTGTGLLALMLAQRLEGRIDAVELDPLAAKQASRNVKDSPWADRITVFHDDIFEFAKGKEIKYDLIISNPPFFTNSQKSIVSGKNKAKHDTETFDKAKLAKALNQLLSAHGKAYVLYPANESRQFEDDVVAQGLYFREGLIIRNQPKGEIFRKISIVSRQELNANPEYLNIREGNTHSEQYNTLLSAYYLKL